MESRHTNNTLGLFDWLAVREAPHIRQTFSTGNRVTYLGYSYTSLVISSLMFGSFSGFLNQFTYKRISTSRAFSRYYSQLAPLLLSRFVIDWAMITEQWYRPGTDIMLFFILLQIILEHNWINASWNKTVFEGVFFPVLNRVRWELWALLNTHCASDLIRIYNNFVTSE